MWLPLVITVQIIGVCVVTSCDNSTNMPTALPYVFMNHLFSSYFCFSVEQKIDNIQMAFSVEPLDPPTRKHRSDAKRE